MTQLGVIDRLWQRVVIGLVALKEFVEPETHLSILPHGCVMVATFDPVGSFG